MKRRRFLETAAGVALSPLVAAAARGASDRVVVAVMGLNGRGTVLARGFARASAT